MNLHVPPSYSPLVKIGTCSWKYPSWGGLIYPEGRPLEPDDYLPYYARHFQTVEIDQWFWSLFPTGARLPDEQTVRMYSDSVPDDFRFTIKAPNAITLTHFYAKQPKTYQSYANQPNPHFLSTELLKRFLDALHPLGNKVGPIMFQFEYLNKKKMPSKEAFLEKLHEFFGQVPREFRYAVETRNPNYLSRDFFLFLKEHEIGYVFLEGYYMPPIAEVFSKHDTFTTDFSIIRLHGGDREEMEARTQNTWDHIVEKRDRGLDAARQITLENMRRQILTFINVNNHYEGSAPLTIERLIERLPGI